MSKIASFTDLRESVPADWDLISKEVKPFKSQLHLRVMDHLRLLNGQQDGFPIDRLEHSLQTATRAYRDNRDDEYVVCALVHDIGDILGCYNHPDVAAVLLKPFVSQLNFDMVEKHGAFQAYYYFHHMGKNRHLRDQYLGTPFYEHTLEFVEKYDATSFDAKYKSEPLEFFEPALQKVFSNPRSTLYIR